MVHFKAIVWIDYKATGDVAVDGGVYGVELELLLYAKDFADAERIVKEYSLKDFEIVSIEVLEDK